MTCAAILQSLAASPSKVSVSSPAVLAAALSVAVLSSVDDEIVRRIS